MGNGDGGWTTYGERPVYDSPWMGVHLVDVRSPSGERFEYHVAELPRVATALVVVDGRVLMLWKYRFPTDQWGYEVPGGMVDPGEEPGVSAARETREETGWRVVGPPEHLLSLEPSPGQVRSRTEVFRWRAAEHDGGPTDPEEAPSTVVWVPLDDVPALVRGGRVLGATTATALLYEALTTREA